MPIAVIVAPTFSQRGCCQSVRATKTPKARQNRGSAGRMYIGNLLPAKEKKITHQALAKSRKPSAAQRLRELASSLDKSQRTAAGASSVIGNKPISNSGK